MPADWQNPDQAVAPPPLFAGDAAPETSGMPPDLDALRRAGNPASPAPPAAGAPAGWQNPDQPAAPPDVLTLQAGLPPPPALAAPGQSGQGAAAAQDSGIWGGLIKPLARDLIDPQTYANVAHDIFHTMTAAAQRTSPVVRDLQGNLNYQRLGDPMTSDAGPAFVDASGQWQVFDPTRQVLLTDPATGKPGVFARNEATEESRPAALGQMLAIGMQAPGVVRVAGAPLIGATVTGTAEESAAAQVGKAITQDAAGGGPAPPASLAEAVATAGGAPMNLADIGGENVTGLAGQAVRVPGPGRQFGIQQLNTRDAGAGTRLSDVVDRNIAQGDDNFTIGQSLADQRRAESAPLYDQALGAGAIDDPEVNGLVKNSAILRNTINSAKANYPQFGNLADNDMTLLDQAYKALGGKANAARQSGDGVLASNLDELRGNFRDALVNANPAYGDALKAFSGYSDSMRAVDQGQGIFQRSPAESGALYSGLAPADQDFYRLGAANALKTEIAKTSSGGNEALRVVGNDLRQQQLRTLFPDDDSFQRFISAAQNEATMFGTRQAVVGNSATAARLAQDAEGAGSIMSPLLDAAVAGFTGEPAFGVRGGLNFLRMAYGRLTQMSPTVAHQVSKMLLTPVDQLPTAGPLAEVLAGGGPPSQLIGQRWAPTGLAWRAAPMTGQVPPAPGQSQQ